MRRNPRDEGVALVTVLGSMTVITLFLLGSLGFTLNNQRPARASQDGRAATAAAQAGIEEYVARLNVNDNYWKSYNDDCANLALVRTPDVTTPACATPRPAAGIAVPGTSGVGTYSYRLLTTPTQVANTGIIRLAVTGRSRGVNRNLIATLSPAGFLHYIYFTDFEHTDPFYVQGELRASLNGVDQKPVAGYTSRFIWYFVDRLVSDPICKTKHWYAGRDTAGYTSGTYIERTVDVWSNGTYTVVSSTVKTLATGEKITYSCLEIAFVTGDEIRGPAKTNDAWLLQGSPWFFSQTTETAWQTAPDPGRPWREGPGGGTPSAGTSTEPGYRPVIGRGLEMPDTNSSLLDLARTNGCVYRGETRFTFQSDGKLKVRSPLTDGSKPECYDGSGTDKLINVPQLVYVEDAPSTATCSNGGIGYPIDKETVDGRLDPGYGCRKGNVYLNGVLKGRTTIAAANDIVVVGDTTYAGELTGGDALGLIPTNSVWVYRPMGANGMSNPLPQTTKVDAAILTIQHSFLVQNWDEGGASGTLRVRGSIAQRFRGTVGKADGSTGYKKDYRYDSRLRGAPPPFFLKPVESPFIVTKVTSGGG